MTLRLNDEIWERGEDIAVTELLCGVGRDFLAKHPTLTDITYATETVNVMLINLAAQAKRLSALESAEWSQILILLLAAKEAESYESVGENPSARGLTMAKAMLRNVATYAERVRNDRARMFIVEPDEDEDDEDEDDEADDLCDFCLRSGVEVEATFNGLTACRECAEEQWRIQDKATAGRGLTMLESYVNQYCSYEAVLALRYVSELTGVQKEE